MALVGRFFGIRSESLSCLERLDCISQYCDLVIHSFLLFFFFFFVLWMVNSIRGI